jgi:hypothetical protein
MDYKAVAQRIQLDRWEVKSRDEHVLVLGPQAEQQARDYIEWRNRLNPESGENAASDGKASC